MVILMCFDFSSFIMCFFFSRGSASSFSGCRKRLKKVIDVSDCKETKESGSFSSKINQARVNHLTTSLKSRFDIVFSGVRTTPTSSTHVSHVPISPTSLYIATTSFDTIMDNIAPFLNVWNLSPIQKHR